MCSSGSVTTSPRSCRWPAGSAVASSSVLSSRSRRRTGCASRSRWTCAGSPAGCTRASPMSCVSSCCSLVRTGEEPSSSPVPRSPRAMHTCRRSRCPCRTRGRRLSARPVGCSSATDGSSWTCPSCIRWSTAHSTWLPGDASSPTDACRGAAVEEAVRTRLAPVNGDKPAVTIIVVDRGGGRGRAADLARSVGSVRAQSLRAVELLVAGSVLPLHEAIGQAAGEFVMLLECGNRLDRHAARSAVAAAQQSGADVVSGDWVRAGDAESLTGPLFRRTTHYNGLAENPELLYDTTVDNKLFSAQLMKRRLGEFTGASTAASFGMVTAAYLQADRITVVPQRMVVQHVEPAPPDPAELLAVHRVLDGIVADHAPELAVAKDVRFLEVDLARYLLGLSAEDSEGGQLLLHPLRDYLDSLRPESLARVGRLVQIAVFMVRQQDIAGAESAVDYLERGHKLPIGLVEQDGRVYWSGRHLDSAEGRATLDVTALGLHELPLSQLCPGSRIAEMRVRRGKAALRGSTVNPLGRISAEARLALSVGPVDTDERSLVPLQVVGHSRELLTWEGTVDLPSVVRPGRSGRRVWAVELSITSGADTTVVPLSAPADGSRAAGALATRVRWYPVGNTLVADVDQRGDLVLRLTPQGRLARQVARFGSRLFPDPAEREDDEEFAPQPVVTTGRLRTKARVLRFLLVRLPLRPRSVVFESHMGLSYSDNPRYVSEELQRREAGFDIVWSFAETAPPVPPGVRTVRRTSWRHFFALARARYWVDNQGLPQAIKKPARVTYLQTWHGSALKRMGEDTPAFRRLPPDRRDRHRQAVQRWNYFVARSEHDVRTLVPALHVRGKILRSGYPRNDPLVQLSSPEDRARVRAELGLPENHTLVLYAPTF